MAFSRITITFNEDLVDGDNIFYSTINPLFDLGATWVSLRSNSFEVTTATPTGNVGEATAIAYKSSFELDYDLSDFIIDQSLNVITVTIRNEVQTFLGGTSNKDVDFVIDSVESIPVEETKRINVRSPYFLYAPIDTGASTIIPDNVVFNLYVWSGDKTTDKPLEPNYIYQKKSRFLNDDVIYIEVSKQIQDFINQSYTGTLQATCVFAAWEITTTYSGGELVSNETVLAFDGYNNHFEGVNYIPDNDLMINNKYITFLTGDIISIPFYVGGDDYNVEFRNGTSVEDDSTITAINITNTDDAVVYVTANADLINNIRVENTTQATEEIIDLELLEECIYDPIKCVFINSDGIQQEFWFFKANKESLTVKSENYKANVLDESIVNNKAMLSYSTSSHNTQTYNTQGKRKITLNTGYIDQDNNILIEELLLSENVWIEKDSNIIPVNQITKAVDFLTKRNDQLVKYTLDFNLSYDQIQNIR